MKKHLTKKEQEEHLRMWKKGGLSKNAYALKAGINPRTFIGWTWLKEKEKETGFVEIPRKVFSERIEKILIRKGSIKVYLPLTVSAEGLQTIFAALGGRE